MKNQILIPSAILAIAIWINPAYVHAAGPELTILPDATLQPQLRLETVLPPPQEIPLSVATQPASNAPDFLVAWPASNSLAALTNTTEWDPVMQDDEGTDDTGTEQVTTATPAKRKMYDALLNVQDKEYLKAIPQLEEVINMDPSLLPAWQALGWSYLEVGRKEDVQKLWNRLQTLSPNEPLVYNNLAMLAAGEGKTAKASELYRQSLELNPDQYEIRLAYNRTLNWLGKYPEAIAGLRNLLKQDPDRVDVRLELARVLMAHQDYEEALGHWNIICEKVPDNVVYSVARAQNLLSLGDLEMAKEEAQRVMELEPDNIRALSMMADIAEFSRKPDDAVKELRKLADRTKDNFRKSKILYRLVTLLHDLHATNPDNYSLAQCIAAAKEGVSCDPRWVDMRLALAELLSEDQQYVAAKNEFEKVLQDFNPNNVRAKNGIIEICLVRGQYDEAERRLKDRLARFDPYDPFRYYYLARLEYVRGNYFDALRMLDRLETEGARGAVFSLLYHGLADIESSALLSV